MGWDLCFRHFPSDLFSVKNPPGFMLYRSICCRGTWATVEIAGMLLLCTVTVTPFMNLSHSIVAYGVAMFDWLQHCFNPLCFTVAMLEFIVDVDGVTAGCLE